MPALVAEAYRKALWPSIAQVSRRSSALAGNSPPSPLINAAISPRARAQLEREPALLLWIGADPGL
jgi:hypothetical protein